MANYLIISDTHIGDIHTNKNLPKLFNLLETYALKEYVLILNGDTLDFAKMLAFDERHKQFFKILKKFQKVIYIEGNHDWFLTGLGDVVPNIVFVKDLYLYLNDKMIHIIHGHQYDKSVMKFPRLTRLLIKMNKWIEHLFGFDIQHWFKQTAFAHKWLVEKQERRLIRKELVANILITGHTHSACQKEINNIMYYNTGNWIENNQCCYILIEDNAIFLKQGEQDD